MPPVEGSQNVTDLKPFLDTGAYLTPHSDMVALMTLEHQTQMENLIIRVGWEARLAMVQNRAMNKAFGEPETQVRESMAHRVDSVVEELLNYMFFNEETVLTSPIKGTSGFTEEFQKLGPKDSKGRSLRDFDSEDPHVSLPVQLSHLHGGLRQHAAGSERSPVPENVGCAYAA